jgi:antitoxin HigA-1
MKTITKSPIKMHNPPHPGEILRELCLDPLGLTVTEAAGALGVSRKTLSSILNGHSGISAEMAIRLSIAFNTTAESWLLQQLQYDLAQIEPKRKSFQVKKLAAA